MFVTNNSINREKVCNQSNESQLFFYLQGKRVLELRFEAGHENITVLSACSAAGVVLNPLIIFKRKNMQYLWYGDKAPAMDNPKMVWIISCKVKIGVPKKWAKLWVYFF